MQSTFGSMPGDVKPYDIIQAIKFEYGEDLSWLIPLPRSSIGTVWEALCCHMLLCFLVNFPEMLSLQHEVATVADPGIWKRGTFFAIITTPTYWIMVTISTSFRAIWI